MQMGTINKKNCAIFNVYEIVSQILLFRDFTTVRKSRNEMKRKSVKEKVNTYAQIPIDTISTGLYRRLIYFFAREFFRWYIYTI